MVPQAVLDGNDPLLVEEVEISRGFGAMHPSLSAAEWLHFTNI